MFAETLVYNRLGSLSVDRHQSNTKLTLTELSIHLKAVLLCGIEGVLSPLIQLAFSPATMRVRVILFPLTTLNSVRYDFCIHLPFTVYACISILFFVILYRWHLYPQCLKTCWPQRRRFLVTPGIVSRAISFSIYDYIFWV